MQEAVNWKRMLIGLFALALFSVPATAGSFGAYGSYWNSEEADKSWGGGARIGFSFVKHLELEFHGTYFPNFDTKLFLQNVGIKATPVDGGLRLNLLPSAIVNPYVGAGVSHYFLDSDQGEIDDQNGWYGEGGLDFGEKNTRAFAEAMWRKLDTDISLGVFDSHTRFDGISFNAGVLWRWGK